MRRLGNIAFQIVHLDACLERVVAVDLGDGIRSFDAPDIAPARKSFGYDAASRRVFGSQLGSLEGAGPAERVSLIGDSACWLFCD